MNESVYTYELKPRHNTVAVVKMVTGKLADRFVGREVIQTNVTASARVY